MAALVVLVLILAIIGGSDAAWCVCRSDLSDSVLQKTLDYACGAGADCTPIQQNGACYQPNTVRAHCSYAANSYYQRKGQAQGACDFSGTATLANSDPSAGSCQYPSSASNAGTSGPATSTNPGAPPTTTTPGTGTTTPGTGTTPGSTGTPTFAPPTTFGPPTGTGGVLGGLGPSGNTISTDNGSHGGFLLKSELGSLLLAMLLSGLVLLRG